MLDEEVVLKTPKHASERLLIINVALLAGISALFFGGTSEFGMGMLVAAGILAPINMIIYKSVWIDAPRHVNFFYTLALFPYIVSFAITVAGLCSPAVEEIIIDSYTYYSMIEENSSIITSAMPEILEPILSDLCTLSIVACALSIYFITDSRYIIRHILILCGLIAVFFALAGFIMDFIRSQNDALAMPFLGMSSFALFPDKFHWTAYATVWLGALMAMSIYTNQTFTLKHYLFSLRFICLLCAGILIGSIVYAGTPIQKVEALLVMGVGFVFLVIDTFPSIENLNRHYPQKSWRPFKKRYIRGGMPSYVYGILSIICLTFGAVFFADSISNPKERLLVDSSDKYSMGLDQRESLILSGKELIKDRYLFGWGTSSYRVLTGFSQDGDFGDTPWLSPRSDLLQKIIENGFVGVALYLITPAIFFLIWLFRRDFSLSGFLMLLTAFVVASTAIIDYPFQSPAVLLGVWVLMMSAFRWDNAEVR